GWIVIARKMSVGWGLATTLLFVMFGCGEENKSPTTGATSPKPNGSQHSSAATDKLPDGHLASLSGKVEIDGSSTVFLVTEAVAAKFMKATNRKVNVTVGIAGTGGGFKRFCIGETDISDASRPILKAEIDKARENNVEFIELPICFDALTVAVH